MGIFQAKRRRLEGLDEFLGGSSLSRSVSSQILSFDRLPPDVTICHVFRHLCVYVDYDMNSQDVILSSLISGSRNEHSEERLPWTRRNANVAGLWGHFSRDVFRHPWFLFGSLHLLPSVVDPLKVVLSSKMLFSLTLPSKFDPPSPLRMLPNLDKFAAPSLWGSATNVRCLSCREVPPPDWEGEELKVVVSSRGPRRGNAWLDYFGDQTRWKRLRVLRLILHRDHGHFRSHSFFQYAAHLRVLSLRFSSVRVYFHLSLLSSLPNLEQLYLGRCTLRVPSTNILLPKLRILGLCLGGIVDAFFQVAEIPELRKVSVSIRETSSSWNLERYRKLESVYVHMVASLQCIHSLLHSPTPHLGFLRIQSATTETLTLPWEVARLRDLSLELPNIQLSPTVDSILSRSPDDLRTLNLKGTIPNSLLSKHSGLLSNLAVLTLCKPPHEALQLIDEDLFFAPKMKLISLAIQLSGVDFPLLSFLWNQVKNSTREPNHEPIATDFNVDDDSDPQVSRLEFKFGYSVAFRSYDMNVLARKATREVSCIRPSQALWQLFVDPQLAPIMSRSTKEIAHLVEQYDQLRRDEGGNSVN